MIPITRIITIAMTAVLCFGVIVPLAVHAHNVFLAVAIPIVYILYLVANVLLWKRLTGKA